MSCSSPGSADDIRRLLHADAFVVRLRSLIHRTSPCNTTTAPPPARRRRATAGASCAAVAPQLPPLARWRKPLDAATADLAPRLGGFQAEDDGWAKDAAVKELVNGATLLASVLGAGAALGPLLK